MEYQGRLVKKRFKMDVFKYQQEFLSCQVSFKGWCVAKGPLACNAGFHANAQGLAMKTPRGRSNCP